MRFKVSVKYQLYKDLASEFVGLLLDSRYMTLKPCYKLLAALPQKRPVFLEEKLEYARSWHTPQRDVYYQLSGCRGGNSCFQCDSRSNGAVVYR